MIEQFTVNSKRLVLLPEEDIETTRADYFPMPGEVWQCESAYAGPTSPFGPGSYVQVTKVELGMAYNWVTVMVLGKPYPNNEHFTIPLDMFVDNFARRP